MDPSIPVWGPDNEVDGPDKNPEQDCPPPVLERKRVVIRQPGSRYA